MHRFVRLLREHDLSVLLFAQQGGVGGGGVGGGLRLRLRSAVRLGVTAVAVLFCVTALFWQLFADRGQCGRLLQRGPCESALRIADVYQRCDWAADSHTCAVRAPPVSFYATVCFSWAALLLSGGLTALCCAAASQLLARLVDLTRRSRVAPEEAPQKVQRDIMSSRRVQHSSMYVCMYVCVYACVDGCGQGIPCRRRRVRAHPDEERHHPAGRQTAQGRQEAS